MEVGWSEKGCGLEVCMEDGGSMRGGSEGTAPLLLLFVLLLRFGILLVTRVLRGVTHPTSFGTSLLPLRSRAVVCPEAV